MIGELDENTVGLVISAWPGSMSAVACIATGDYETAEVANSDIGMAVGWPKKNGRGIELWVEFLTQHGLRFAVRESEFNSRKYSPELLEVAHAVTVHKPQGSQFELPFVVGPNPCPLLSPERLYRVLTRHRARTIRFVQEIHCGSSSWDDLARSETACRLTCLFRIPD